MVQTHCAGSIAGSSAEPTVGAGDVNDFAGMAPEAKLAVTGVADEMGYFRFPPGNDTFPMDWARLLGAKVHSASWGGYSTRTPNPCIPCGVGTVGITAHVARCSRLGVLRGRLRTAPQV